MSSELMDRFVPPSAPPVGAELRLIALALFSRFKLIAFVVCISVLLCIAFLWASDVEYKSTAEILIDPRPKQLLEREVAPTGLGSSSLGPDTLLLDSQIEVIQSPSVLDKVIELHGLAGDPQYGKAQAGDVKSSIKSLVRWISRGPQSEMVPDEGPRDRALRMLMEGLRVERKGNTYVVAISMRSTDRFKAAEIANSISSIYVNESNSASSTVAQEAATSLTQRLEKLQREATAANQKVEEYRKQNGLTGSPDNLVVEQQLRELNTLLTSARAATKEEEALWKEVEAVSSSQPAQLSAISKLESPLLSQLRLQLAAAVADEQAQSARFLPKHPLAQAAMLGRKAIEKVVAAEIQGIIIRQKVKYDAALRKERDIESKVKDLESKSTQLRMASVELNELIADAKMRQDMLGSFMNRARLAVEQVGLPASTIRIIARATPATRPSWPPAQLLFTASALLGGVLGVMLAWLMHLMNGTKEKISARGKKNAPGWPPTPAGEVNISAGHS